MPGRAVVDVLTDLRGDAAGKIGIDAGDERRRDDGAALQLIARLLRHDAIREIACLAQVGVEEVLLLALSVRIDVLSAEPRLSMIAESGPRIFAQKGL